MDSPEKADAPAPSPLDAERARLRKEGYTDHEISQILISRASAPPHAMAGGGGGQGVMTGVLSNLTAVLAHSRVLLPSFKADFAAMFDRASTPLMRVWAAVILVFKTAVVSVLAYAVYQEWQQHIVSQTEIAAITARKIHAEECSARMKTFTEITPVDNLLDPALTDGIQRDCDPAYAAHAKACDQKFDALFSQLQQADKKNTLAIDTLGIGLFKHKQDCVITLEQRAKLDTMKAELDASSERVKVMAGVVLTEKYDEEAKREFNAGHYAAALDAKEKGRETVEKIEGQKLGRAGQGTGAALTNLGVVCPVCGRIFESVEGFRTGAGARSARPCNRDQSRACADVHGQNRGGEGRLSRATRREDQ